MRFAKIKEKKPEEICMYLNYSGQVTNSSEIKKEHYISKCLQRHIENWLRHVLTFDPSRRSQNFPGDIKVFDYLSLILRKKIINVFSLHKLEFYSYEVNEGTLVGTLKQWISRDIKVQKDELILLIDKDALCMDIDNMLLTEIMKEETNVYVLCRNVLIADNVTYIFPKLIKEAMKSSLKFNMSYMRQLKAQMVYYISIEKTTANFFRTCFHLYLRYVNHSVEDVERKSLSLANEFSKLLTRVENYTRTQKNNICDIDLRNNIEYKDCVSYSQRLLASLERSFSNLKELKQRIRVMKRKKDLGEYNSEITKKIDLYDLQDQYAKALGIVENNNRTSDISDPKDVIKRITDLISETVRLKYIFLGNKEFRAYLSASGKVLIYTKTLLNWIQEFEGHLQKMSESFEKAEIIYRDIFFRAANVEKYREVTSKKDIRDRPTSYLIKENQDLRYKFEEILAKSIMAHKKYTQSMEI